jgi:hypothetical protein
MGDLMRRLAILGIVAAALFGTASSMASATGHCPPGQKVCLVSGEAPIPGAYRLFGGGSLTVAKTGHGFVLRDLGARVGKKEGCALSGRLAEIGGSQQLSKQGKSTFIGAGETETTYTWRSATRKARIRFGSKTYIGSLFSKFLDVDGTQSVEGHFRFEPEEEVVCEGQFLGGPS